MLRSLLFQVSVALLLIGSGATALGDCTMAITSIVPKDEAWVTVSGTAGGDACGQTYIEMKWAGATVSYVPAACPNSASCSATGDLDATCLQPGVPYTMAGFSTCYKRDESSNCVPDNRKDVTSIYYEAQRSLTANLQKQPHPTISTAYNASVSYNIPRTGYICRSMRLERRDKENPVPTFFRPLNVQNSSSGTAVTDPIQQECKPFQIRAVATATVAAEMRVGSWDDIPPRIDRTEPGEPLPTGTCALRGGKCGNGVGRPINVGSGDVTLTIPLFSIDEPVDDLQFALTYHSELPAYPSISGELGFGWHHPFSARLMALDDEFEYLYFVDGTGVEQIFVTQPGVAGWVPGMPTNSTDTVSGTATTYQLLHADGSYESFDRETGRWLSRTDRWGNATTAQYDGSGNLTSITDPLGRVITISASGNNINQITLPGGASWRFTYTNGNLTSIFDPLHAGSTAWRTLTYESDPTGDPRLLTAMRDDAGILLEGHTYDAQRRGITSVVHGDREQVTVQYDYPSVGQRRITHVIDGTRSQVTDMGVAIKNARWVPTSSSGTGCASCGGASQSLAYNDDGQVTSATDEAGIITTYTYDDAGNVATVTQAAGTSLARTTTYTQALTDWRSFTTQEVTPAPFGSRTTTRDWTNNEQTLSVSVTGRLVSGAAPVTYTTTSTFDTRHRLLTTNGPRTDVTDLETREYYADNDADVLRRGRLKKITDAVGLTTTFDDYDVYGTPRQVTDPNGVVTASITDARGRVTSTTTQPVTGDPNEASAFTSTSTYDSRDRLSESTTARGHTTGYTYEDGTNYLTSTIRRDDLGRQAERMLLTLNALGWKTMEQAQTCASPATTCATWTTKRSESFTYDDKGQLVTTTHPDSTTISYTYDVMGRVKTVKDENHSAANTTYNYDALGRLTSVQQTLTGAPGGQITTSYTFDVADNLSSVTDPNGNVTTYSYDDFGRLRSQTSPVTGTTTYTYDAAGNLTSTTDANGNVATRSYDAASRVLTTTAANTTVTETITHTYDDTTTGNYARGRIASVTDPSGVTSYAYERRGLLRREQRTINAVAFTSTYSYDAGGNRTGLTTPSGRSIAYTFDYADRPLTATTGGTSLVSASTYAPFGPLTSLTNGNGATVTREHDQRYQISANQIARAGSTIARYTYAHDNAGNITGITDAVDATYSRTFTYDDLHRLTSANTGANLWSTGAYSYDRMGNLLSAQIGSRTATFAYRGTTPQLLSATENGTARTVTYDAAGNEAGIGSATYSYTPRNALAAADQFTYTYDARGIRTIAATSASGVGVASVAASPSTVTGGQNTTGTVQLTAAPATNITVGLTSDNSALASVPASVVVPSGSTSASFTITTTAPGVTSTVIIRANALGTQSTTTLTVRSTNLEVNQLTITPTNAVGGRVTPTGTVNLTGPAPTGGATVTLTSSYPTAATVPTSVNVPAGASTTTFPITTSTVGSPTTVNITASYGYTAAASLTVTTCGAWSPDLAGTASETVWFDDDIPPGGVPYIIYYPWEWDTAYKQSGTRSGLLRFTDGSGSARMDFQNATTPFSLATTDQLVAYVLTDPCNPPDQVLLQFRDSNGWEHRAFWGANAIGWGTWGTGERRPMGALPTPGIWTRLTVPANAVDLGGKTITGMGLAISRNGSKAWIDRVGKEACIINTATAPSSFPTSEEVWFDDALPSGATPVGTINWDTVQKASGTQSHHTPRANGTHQHYFTTGASITPAAGDSLFVYVLIDPCDPPSEIMFQWYDGTSWEHRAYWGADVIGNGTNATNSRRPMGPLPKWGEWVRLEVAADRVGLVGVPISGMAFTLYGGHAWFDRVGKYACTFPSPAPPSLPGTDVIWFDDALPTGASQYQPWQTDTTRAASGTTSFYSAPAEGLHDLIFTGATQTMTLSATDTIIAYVLLDPCNPPREIMLQFNDGSFEHRAYWGENLIGHGYDNTETRWRIGDLPPLGEWVRLRVPATAVGLAGRTVTGIALSQYGGNARFDRVGKAPAGYAAVGSPGTTLLAQQQPRPSLWHRLRTRFSRSKPAPPVSLSVTAAVALPTQSHTAGVAEKYSFYTPELQLLAETNSTDGTPTIAHEYVWFNGEPVAQIETATGAIHYYFNDHLGSPLLTTNSAGAVDWRVEREPYGSIVSTRAGADRYQPLSLPGQEYDAQSPDRAYNIARWYRARWGRYGESDPIGLDGGPNLYLYGFANPIKNIDPLGLVCGVDVWSQSIGDGGFWGWLSSAVEHMWVTWPTGSAGFYPRGGSDAVTMTRGVLFPTRGHVKDEYSGEGDPDVRRYETYFTGGVAQECECVYKCLENYKQACNGKSWWLFGRNCQTFALNMLGRCGLTTDVATAMGK